jgi:hypothetical protein
MGSTEEGSTNDHAMKEAELIFRCISIILKSLTLRLSRAFFGGIGTAALTHRAVSFSFGM